MKKIVVNLRTVLVLAGSLFACLSSGGLAMAQLPPAVMADRYLVQADRELRNGDAAAAAETLNLIVVLQAEHGLEVPEVFWFRRAVAAYAAGDMELTIVSVVRYIEVSGQDSEHYLAALELYDAAELAKAEADARVAAQRAEAERLAAEEEALAAAVAAVAPEMVVIPAGRFRMGCVSGQACVHDEQPVHEVTIPLSFAVSKYEVTFAEWDACVLGGGCGGYSPDDRGWGRGARPVIAVSRDDAQAYVAWLSRQTGQTYRLLNEAEWEYVARAGSSTAYSWGNGIGSNLANCYGCGSQWDNNQTAPVGSFQPNAFGVYDMHGNVREWVEDCWNESYAGAPTNGSAWRVGDCSARVLRGGAWLSDPGFLRSADRNRGTAGGRYSSSGFRVARTLTP